MRSGEPKGLWSEKEGVKIGYTTLVTYNLNPSRKDKTNTDTNSGEDKSNGTSSH